MLSALVQRHPERRTPSLLTSEALPGPRGTQSSEKGPGGAGKAAAPVPGLVCVCADACACDLIKYR